MTDLLQLLPDFPASKFASLLPKIENNGLTTTDLLALHPVDIAKHAQVPLLDLKRLLVAVQEALSQDVQVTQVVTAPWHATVQDTTATSTSATSEEEVKESSAIASPAELETISTLDSDVDDALGGGVPLGRLTEITGESGTCKTQFLLTLCLAVQMPAPHGQARKALYISTEASLATSRLKQIIGSHPVIQSLDQAARPSMDNIMSITTPDLESQDHILEYQVPVLLSRHQIGLVVIDSVAANYRAEFERQGNRGSNMATRSADLTRLGARLRDMSRRRNLAVIVANQVADRISPLRLPSSSAAPSQQQQHHQAALTQESPIASRTMAPPPPSLPISGTPSSSAPFPHHSDGNIAPPQSLPALQLDYQQRWFTGWGDEPRSSMSLKTPSLGLVWTTQIACRVALFKRPVYGRPRRLAAPLTADDYDDVADDYSASTLKSWRRWMKVVFAPHVAASGQGLDGAVEFEVAKTGLHAVRRAKKENVPDHA